MWGRSRRRPFDAVSRRDFRILALLLAATIASCLLATPWGLPDGASPETSVTWGVDTIAPLGPLNEAYHRFTRAGTDDVIYPLFHYMVLAAAYAPYIALAVLTGALDEPSATFPYGARDPASFFMHLTVLAALVSALMAAGIVLLTWLLTREIFDDNRAALWAATFAALVPPLAYYGMTSNLDVPYLFWTLFALWLLTRGSRTGGTTAFLLAGVCAGLAVATKDQAFGFLIAMPLMVPVLVARARRNEQRDGHVLAALFDRRTLGAGAAAALAFALANNLLFGGFDGFLRHLQFADTFYAANVAAVDGVTLLARQPRLAAESSLLLFEMVGVPVLVLALAGVVLATRRRTPLAWVLPAVVLTYYIVIIAPTITLSRYLIGIALLAMPFAGLAVAAGMQHVRRSPRMAIGALAVSALLWQGALLVHLHTTLQADGRFTMGRWIRANVPAGSLIESATQARYLPRIGTHARYEIVGNSFDAISYDLVASELSAERLADRDPDYVLVLTGSGLSGDPLRVSEPHLRAYFDQLLAGHAGYTQVARFETPRWLPYRQITAGTQPTAILLKRAL